MKRALWLLVVAIWTCLLASGLFTRIEADDYCFAEVIKQIGAIEGVAHWYRSWSGLYTDHLLSGVLAAIEPYGARIGVPLMLIAFVLAWWYAFSCWYPRRDALLVALAFGAALAMSRPNDEPIYWLSGITSYWMPIAGWGLLVGALARRQAVLAALAAFVTVSLSEAGGALLLAGLGLAWLVWRGERRRLLVVGASAAFGFLIMYLAPGNAVRKAAFIPLELDLPLALRIVLGGFATNVVLSAIWSAVPGLFLSGVGALLPPPFPVRRLPLLFLGLALGAAFVVAVLALLTTGWGVGERAIFLLTPLWLAQWYFLGALIGQRMPSWRWATLVSVVLLVSAASHVVERAAYAAAWDARHAQIVAGQPVDVLDSRWDSLTSQPWITDCAEAWYGREIQFINQPNVP